MQWLLVFTLVACHHESPPTLEQQPPPPTAQPPFGSALFLLRTISGGILVLRGNPNAAMTNATIEMTKHCGKGAYTIVRNGEESIGDPIPHFEWRVHYTCNRHH